jgi:hypothetical protein
VGAVTASAAATGVVLAEAMVFMAVISGAASALLTAPTTTMIMVTQGARGAHAITDVGQELCGRIVNKQNRCIGTGTKAALVTHAK